MKTMNGEVRKLNEKELEGYRNETQPTREQQREQTGKPQLTCERCGNKTDGGAWLGFVYVGAECLTESDKEYLE